MTSKNVITAALVLFALAAITANLMRKGEQGRSDDLDTGDGVQVWYFHGDKRCDTCRAIEKRSHEVLEALPDEDRPPWRVINFDDPGKTHFREDFGLITSSLVLVELSKGRPVRHAVLEDVWLLTKEPDKFRAYVNRELKRFRENAP